MAMCVHDLTSRWAVLWMTAWRQRRVWRSTEMNIFLDSCDRVYFSFVATCHCRTIDWHLDGLERELENRQTRNVEGLHLIIKHWRPFSLLLIREIPYVRPNTLRARRPAYGRVCMCGFVRIWPRLTFGANNLDHVPNLLVCNGAFIIYLKLLFCRCCQSVCCWVRHCCLIAARLAAAIDADSPTD